MGRGGDGGVEVGTGGVGWGWVAQIVMGLSEVRMSEVRWRWGWARWSGVGWCVRAGLEGWGEGAGGDGGVRGRRANPTTRSSYKYLYHICILFLLIVSISLPTHTPFF